MNLDRRGFLRTSAVAGAGLVIATHVLPKSRVWAAPPTPPGPLPDPNAFLRIGTDGSTTILLAHSEMGQGIWTTLAMLVAEELGSDWSKMRVEHAPAAPAYHHTAFGIQMTGGSTSTWSEFDRYRQVGAMARDMLIRAAAARWKVPALRCKVEDGHVVSGRRKLGFGALADAAAKLTPPAEAKLKKPRDWKIIGKPTRRLDAPEKVSGEARFGMDVRLPGMLTALVARSPVFGGKLKRFRAERARAVPGVKKVVRVPSGVAVIAEHFWAAKLGRDALSIDWDEGPGRQLDSVRLRGQYRDLARKPGARAASAGDVEVALRGAVQTLEADYEFPYLAHAPMEPLNCTVRLSSGACEVWTGTQLQTMDHQLTAKITGLAPEQVKVHTMFLGGGFGRRATTNSDFVTEAVHVAKAARLNVPIKVVWTREDDIRGGYYRPMWTHHLRVGLGKNGRPMAWRQTIVGQSIIEGTPFAAGMKEGAVDATSVEGAANSPYVKPVPHHLVDLHSPTSPIPVLWWRSVGHTHTAFVMETFIDELARLAGKDPLAYRRQLLRGNPRHLGVLELAAKKAGWGKPLPRGRFRGLAVHESFGSYVAQVAEVSVTGAAVRVHRVVCAIDCGVCVNPAGVRAQMESGIVFGLGAALHGELTLKEGRVVQSNFHDYPVLRMVEMPSVEVHIVKSHERSGGAGEPGTPPVAPAVANALFAATGKRFRQLPFRLGAS